MGEEFFREEDLVKIYNYFKQHMGRKLLGKKLIRVSKQEVTVFLRFRAGKNKLIVARISRHSIVMELEVRYNTLTTLTAEPSRENHYKPEEIGVIFMNLFKDIMAKETDEVMDLGLQWD